MDRDFDIKRLDAGDVDVLRKLAKHLRPQDKEEMKASGITDFFLEVKNTVRYSKECYKVLTPSNAVIACFGIIHTNAGGQIWLLGTNLLRQYRKSFVKLSNDILSQWQRKYGKLFNYVSAQNTESIKWLKFIGAKMEEKHVYNGHVFIRFEIERMS